MSEQITKTIENVDTMFSEIVVNGETFISDKYVPEEKSAPYIPPKEAVEETPSVPTERKSQGQPVHAVDLNDVVHNISDKSLTDQVNELSDSLDSEITTRQSEDTALSQRINNISDSLDSEITTRQSEGTALSQRIGAIEELVPNTATADNKLADEDFVNSSVATNTANFLGTYRTLAEIEALPDPTNNDYAFWLTTDADGNVVYKRYKYNAQSAQWAFEYDLNNSSFTAEQWATINSGITEQTIENLQDEIDALSGKQLCTDADNETRTLSYYNSATLNTPYKAGLTSYSDGLLITRVTDTNQYASQLCPTSGGKIYWRVKKQGTWTSWEEVTTQTELDKKLSLSGGTMTGSLTFPANQYITGGKFAIDLKNSDIINANAITFNDSSQANEGIIFPRTASGEQDCLAVIDKEIMLNTHHLTIEKLWSGNFGTASSNFVFTTDTSKYWKKWDAMLVMAVMYSGSVTAQSDSDEQCITLLIPTDSIAYVTATPQNKFLLCGSTGGTGRRIYIGFQTNDTYGGRLYTGTIEGTSGHMPKIIAVYGLRLTDREHTGS